MCQWGRNEESHQFEATFFLALYAVGLRGPHWWHANCTRQARQSNFSIETGGSIQQLDCLRAAANLQIHADFMLPGGNFGLWLVSSWILIIPDTQMWKALQISFNVQTVHGKVTIWRYLKTSWVTVDLPPWALPGLAAFACCPLPVSKEEGKETAHRRVWNKFAAENVEPNKFIPVQDSRSFSMTNFQAL